MIKLDMQGTPISECDRHLIQFQIITEFADGSKDTDNFRTHGWTTKDMRKFEKELKILLKKLSDYRKKQTVSEKPPSMNVKIISAA